MNEHSFSPLRSTAPRKPWPYSPEINLYYCPQCKTILHKLSATLEHSFSCCGEPLEKLQPLPHTKLPEGYTIDYAIVGGFNCSAIQVSWKSETTSLKPDWILLRTFTGSYIKYVDEKKDSPLIFPLSDEDAYVYCDREVCKQCSFRCKLGFIAYLFFTDIGLFELPLDKVSDFFKTAR